MRQYKTWIVDCGFNQNGSKVTYNLVSDEVLTLDTISS